MSSEVELLLLVSLMHTTLAAYNSIARKDIVTDFILWIFPTFVCIIHPEKSIPMHLLCLALLFANGFKRFSIRIKESVQRKSHPGLFLARGHLMLMVTVSIFACDFSFFPCKFLKTKHYGISLMDLGTGSFLYHNGVASVYLPRRKLLRSVAINVFLGMIRLATIRYFDYAVEITEYGRDLNFYFVLAITYVLFAIIKTRYNFYTALLFICMHQVLLKYGLEDYVFRTRRDNFLDLNKEGLIGVLPSLAIFLFSNEVGHIMFAKENDLVKAARLFFYGISFIYGYSFTSERIEASRRLGNVSYVLWIMLIHTVQLLLCHMVSVLGMQTSFLQNFSSENMMFIFLWSNVLVLVSNLCFDLRKLDYYMSVAFNIVYLILVFVVPAYVGRVYLALRMKKRMLVHQR